MKIKKILALMLAAVLTISSVTSVVAEELAVNSVTPDVVEEIPVEYMEIVDSSYNSLARETMFVNTVTTGFTRTSYSATTTLRMRCSGYIRAVLQKKNSSGEFVDYNSKQANYTSTYMQSVSKSISSLPAGTYRLKVIVYACVETTKEYEYVYAYSTAKTFS